MTTVATWRERIRPATDADEDWIEDVFSEYEDILGPFSTAWWRWQDSDTERDRWVVIEPVAFAHYLDRLDGWHTLYEIGVRADAQANGLGTALLRHIGTPMRLKTDADNARSNVFYQRNGFEAVDLKPTDSGKTVRVYEREEPFEAES